MKILFLAMSLGIGGAETHILSLTAELLRRGHKITIASAGGMLEKVTVRLGARCLRIPLASTSPTDMLRARIRIESLLAAEHFDLIHAHARIPAFLCGPSARRAGIPMVTTAHGCYRTDPLLRRLTDWGDGVIAVSCTVKAYLLSQYHLPEEMIALTVNGIEIERFSACPEGLSEKATAQPLCAGENEGTPCAPSCRLLHVSRLDTDSDAAAWALIRIAPMLKARFPTFSLTIVGDGTQAHALRAAAAALPHVRFLGAREDIPALLRQCDCFVGVSRAALEAMACELPVVLAGQQGQLGLFTPEKADIAASGNFCCTDQPSSDRFLLSEATRALSLSPKERQIMGRANRTLVTERYSIKRMADDAEQIYRKVRRGRDKGGLRVLIGGYFGCGNCGDEAILAGILQELDSEMPHAQITVLTASPRETSLRFGVRTLYRCDTAIPAEMAETDLFLLGGGSLLTDITSARSLGYYVGLVELARRSGCRVAIRAAGIGPFCTEKSYRLAAHALRCADEITVRDRLSLRIAKKMCRVRQSDLGASQASDHSISLPTLTADPALSLPPPDPDRKRYLLSALAIGEGQYFALALRPLPGSPEMTERLVYSLSRLIRSAAKQTGKTPLFLSMHRAEDPTFSALVAKRTGGRLLPPLSPSDTEAVLSACAFALPMRLHAMILAHRASIPILALSYDQKTDAFCAEHHIRVLRRREGGDYPSCIAKSCCLSPDPPYLRAEK